MPQQLNSVHSATTICTNIQYLKYTIKAIHDFLFCKTKDYCRSLKRVKFSTDQSRPALGSGCCLIDWLSIVTMLKKPQNCPISDFFDLTPKYFLPLLPYTDLVPPSTDPVPPSTNQYRPILTQYHHGSTITALYWSIATMYQQVEPHTDPVPSCINQYRLLLTQYHQVPTGTAFYWTSTII